MKNNKRQNRLIRLDSALGELGSILTQSLALDKKLNSVINSLKNITGADGTSIWLIEKSKGIIKCTAAAGIHVKILNKDYSLEEKGMTPFVARYGEPQLSNGYNEHKKNKNHQGKFDKILFTKDGERCESFMLVPLRIGDKIIGVVKADSTTPNFFSALDDLWLFEHLAAVSAIVISNEQDRSTMEYTQERARRLDAALTHLGSVLTLAEPLLEKLDSITKALMEITKADGTSIWLIEEDNEILRCKAGAGIYTKILDKYYGINENGITPFIAREGQPIISRAYEEHKKKERHAGKFDHILYKHGERCESFMQYPLKIGEKIIGVVKADSIHPDFFSQENDSWLFYHLAVITAIIIRNDQEREKEEKGKKLMAAVAVHNLDNPSTTVRNALDNLTKLLEKGDFDSEKFKKIINSAKNRIEEILVTREIYLTFINPDRGKNVEVVMCKVNLYLFVEKIVFVVKAENQRVQIKINIPEHLRFIRIPKLQLSIAINVLITNALEATQSKADAEIEINIKTANQVDVEFIKSQSFQYVSDTFINMDIKDNGKGVPSEIQKNLFKEQFSTKTLGGGLGLYSSKKIMQNIGGDIHFLKEENAVTTFRIICPYMIGD